MRKEGNGVVNTAFQHRLYCLLPSANAHTQAHTSAHTHTLSLSLSLSLALSLSRSLARSLAGANQHEFSSLTLRSTGSGHSLHSTSSSQGVYSGQGSHRSRHSAHSTHSNPPLARRSVKDFFQEEPESGVVSQVRGPGDVHGVGHGSASGTGDRDRSGTFPRTAPPPHHVVARHPPFTLPRERADATRTVFDSRFPPVTPTTQVYFERSYSASHAAHQQPQQQSHHQHHPQQSNMRGRSSSQRGSSGWWGGGVLF